MQNNDVLGRVIGIIAKFMYRNSIVLFHVKLNNGHNGFVTPEFLYELFRKYNITYDERSSVSRVNVNLSSDGSYFLRRDSNDAQVLQFYSKYLTFRPTGVAFEQELESILKSATTRRGKNEVLAKWLKNKKFMSLYYRNSSGHDVDIAYICLTDGATANIGVGLTPEATYSCYITPEDLRNYGFTVEDINIFAYAQYNIRHQFYAIKWRPLVTRDGWCIEELLSKGKADIIGVTNIDIIGYIVLRRLYNKYISVLPDSIAQAIGYVELRYPYQVCCGVGFGDPYLNAEAQLRYFEINNQRILDEARRVIGGANYYVYQEAYKRGYIKHPPIYLKDFTIRQSVNRAMGVTEDTGRVYSDAEVAEEPNDNTIFREIKNSLSKLFKSKIQ